MIVVLLRGGRRPLLSTGCARGLLWETAWLIRELLVFCLTQYRNLPIPDSLSYGISYSDFRPYFSHCLRHLFFPVGLPWPVCPSVDQVVNPAHWHVGDPWVSWLWQAWGDLALTAFTKKACVFPVGLYFSGQHGFRIVLNASLLWGKMTFPVHLKNPKYSII